MKAVIGMDYNRSRYTVIFTMEDGELHAYLTTSIVSLKLLLKKFGIREVSIDPELPVSYRDMIAGHFQ